MTTLRGGKAPWATFLSALSTYTGNTADEAVTLTAVETWTTEAEYEFGDRFEGDALFGLIVDVALTPDGSRVYVLDYRAAEVTIWTTGGKLISRFGREGEGPGEFHDPGRFHLYDDSLVVREWRRGFTTFSLDGDFIGWHAIPPFVSWRGFSFSYESLLADGSFLVTPVVGGMISEGLTGDDPIHEIPWLRVARETGSWTLDSVALRSDRNTTIVFPGTGTTVATFFDQLRRLKEGASHVWYAARRGDAEGPIRRIVLPEDFKPRYVDDTHIWGDRSDELGVTYVAGRRLVRARE